MTTMVMWVLMSVGSVQPLYAKPVGDVESCMELRQEAMQKYKGYNFKCIAVKMRAEV